MDTAVAHAPVANEQVAVCRVTLLNPPTAAPSSELLLNIAYLSAVLKQAGHQVQVIDATAPHKRRSAAEVMTEIQAFRPDFIGITLTITYIPASYAFMGKLRGLGIPIVAGGPHANCQPEEVLAHGADIVAVGEGEQTILDLAEHFTRGKPLAEIAGICFREAGELRQTPTRALIKELDSIPFPDYSEFPIRYYTGSDDPHSNPLFWSIFSSRGCPFNCIFCSSHNVFGRSYRARTPGNVHAEVESLAERFGTRRFAFQDDEAFVRKDRILEFCRLVRAGRDDLRFSARMRIDSLDEEMLRAMKEAGFSRLSFGVENFHDETLKKINKGYTAAKVMSGFECLARVGFKAVSFNQIIGFPWETPAHLDVCLKAIASLPAGLRFCVFTGTPLPYPKTKLYDQYHAEYGFTGWWLEEQRNSVRPHADWSHAFFTICYWGQGPIFVDDLFWNYDDAMKRAIRRFSWAACDLSIRSMLHRWEYHVVRLTSRLSHRLWRWSPTLERVLLWPACQLAKWRKFHQRTSFPHQW